MAQTIYCIPGFGADERIFKNLTIHAKLVYMNWLDPHRHESLEHYAHRMAASIQDPEPVIMGVSFGGMLALEIAKFLPVKKIILVSSVKTRNELPLRLRVIGRLNLDKIFPVKKIQSDDRFYELANKRLGAYTDEEKAFANAYRRNTGLYYINWSFDKILNWKNLLYPAHVLHIHGDADQIFPLKNINADYIIKGGTHMMIMNRAAEISGIVNREIP